MDSNLIMHLDPLGASVTNSSVETQDPTLATKIVLVNTKPSDNVRVAIRPRQNNLVVPQVANQNPTAVVHQNNNYFATCLGTQPEFTAALSVDCTGSNSDVALEIDAAANYILTEDGVTLHRIKGSDLASYLTNNLGGEVYTDTEYPSYNGEFFCTPSDLGTMYASSLATTNDVGLIIKYQINDDNVRTFITNVNLDIATVDSVRFIDLFATELNGLNIGPVINITKTDLVTQAQTSNNINNPNFQLDLKVGNIGLLPFGEFPSVFMGYLGLENAYNPVTIRFHKTTEAVLNGVTIKGNNGATSGYIDMFSHLFGSAETYAEVVTCGFANDIGDSDE